MKFNSLAVSNPQELIFGYAPKMVRTKRGLNIGGGIVYPEVNFTLPPMEVSKANLPIAIRHYTEIVEGVLERAVQLIVLKLLCLGNAEQLQI